MALAFSVITDEISQDLGACLAFAADEGLDRVDVRSVERANFLSLDAARQRRIARQIRDAGLAVGCLATPLLKWPAPGRTAASAGDQFGFDAKGRPETEIFAAAFEAGQILGTRHLRVFSYLTCDGFQLADLEAPFAALLRLAESHDMVLHVENEPVCNVRTLGDLDALMRSWRHPRLKALLDIGNAASAGAPATVAGVASLAPHVDQAHFKDYSKARRAYVALGEGDIPYRELLAPCLAEARTRELVLTVETHVPGDRPDATRRSLAGLRRLAAGAA